MSLDHFAILIFFLFTGVCYYGKVQRRHLAYKLSAICVNASEALLPTPHSLLLSVWVVAKAAKFESGYTQAFSFCLSLQ